MSTGLLSDKSPKNGNKPSVVSRRQMYSDLDLSLYHSEQTKNDIVPLDDIDAVVNSVRNLLLTNHFDRPFQPYLGANLIALLFEPANQFTIFALRENIEFILEKFEPRIQDIRAVVQFEEDSNRYRVTLTFRVINQAKAVDMNVFLSRVR